MINRKSTPSRTSVSASGSSSSGPASNFLSSAVTVKGSLTSDHDATIAGVIEGDVHIRGMLKMEKNGFVKGKIFATNVDIAGKVEGIIHCENLATLRSDAIIRADIHTKSLQVDDGAQIKGQIKMNSKG